MAEEAKRTDIIINGTEASWDINMLGDVSGSFIGAFKFRCMLTPTQKIAANREMRDLLGPQMLLASEHDQNLAFALTQLKYRVVEAPPFWRSGGIIAGDLVDSNVIMSVLDAAIASELKYIEQLKDRKMDAINRAKAAAEKALAAVTSDDPDGEFDEE
jgi:hypothetical protein